MSSNSSEVIHSVGGAHTHVILEMADEGTPSPAIYLGNVMTVSYSVYREKTPVFVCGSHNTEGFAIGKRYVAGSLITLMHGKEDMTLFMKEMEESAENNPFRDRIIPAKQYHTFMKDDLVPFNIHLIFTTEYANEANRVIIYGATFINNGQVMSINDLITETTVSYVASDVRELHTLTDDIGLICKQPTYLKASNL